MTSPIKNRICGIDPSWVTGLAIVDFEWDWAYDTANLVRAHVIDVHRSIGTEHSEIDKIEYVRKHTKNFLGTWKPQIVAIELNFVSHMNKSVLYQARLVQSLLDVTRDLGMLHKDSEINIHTARAGVIPGVRAKLRDKDVVRDRLVKDLQIVWPEKTLKGHKTTVTDAIAVTMGFAKRRRDAGLSA